MAFWVQGLDGAACFGCPACSKPLDLERITGHELAWNLRCCGYHPTQEEARRWAHAARAIRERA